MIGLRISGTCDAINYTCWSSWRAGQTFSPNSGGADSSSNTRISRLFPPLSISVQRRAPWTDVIIGFNAGRNRIIIGDYRWFIQRLAAQQPGLAHYCTGKSRKRAAELPRARAFADCASAESKSELDQVTGYSRVGPWPFPWIFQLNAAGIHFLLKLRSTWIKFLSTLVENWPVFSIKCG